MPVTSPPCNRSKGPEAHPHPEGNRGEGSGGIGIAGRVIRVLSSGGSPLLICGVVLACPTVGGQTAYCDHRNLCKQGCGHYGPEVRSTCSNCHGCVRCSVASCTGCAYPTVCGAATCVARSHFRIGCSTPSVQAPLTSFRVAPTFAAMANNRDAAPRIRGRRGG